MVGNLINKSGIYDELKLKVSIKVSEQTILVQCIFT